MEGAVLSPGSRSAVRGETYLLWNGVYRYFTGTPDEVGANLALYKFPGSTMALPKRVPRAGRSDEVEGELRETYGLAYYRLVVATAVPYKAARGNDIRVGALHLALEPLGNDEVRTPCDYADYPVRRQAAAAFIKHHEDTKAPTGIQRGTSGLLNVKACNIVVAAPTGFGKTDCALAAVQQSLQAGFVARPLKGPAVLVVVPTHALAGQTAAVYRDLLEKTYEEECAARQGGRPFGASAYVKPLVVNASDHTSAQEAREMFCKSVSVLVTTTGTLVSWLTMNVVNLLGVRVVVFDECPRLVESGQAALLASRVFPNLNPWCARILLSACTMTDGLVECASHLLAGSQRETLCAVCREPDLMCPNVTKRFFARRGWANASQLAVELVQKHLTFVQEVVNQYDPYILCTGSDRPDFPITGRIILAGQSGGDVDVLAERLQQQGVEDFIYTWKGAWYQVNACRGHEVHYAPMTNEEVTHVVQASYAPCSVMVMTHGQLHGLDIAHAHYIVLVNVRAEDLQNMIGRVGRTRIAGQRETSCYPGRADVILQVGKDADCGVATAFLQQEAAADGERHGLEAFSRHFEKRYAFDARHVPATDSLLALQEVSGTPVDTSVGGRRADASRVLGR